VDEIKTSWDKALPQPKQEKLVVDDLNAIHKAYKEHGFLSTEERTATQKFLDDLNDPALKLSVTEKIAAAHRANVLELHDALENGHDPVVYFPSWKDGKLLPQFANGTLTNYTTARYGHMKDDNSAWLDQDLAQEEKERKAAEEREAARKKLMGH
jgi:hypothetical protein